MVELQPNRTAAMASRRSGVLAAGNMDATEYKHVVLGSIFIKYVSAERF
jgi:hypothetical protein